MLEVLLYKDFTKRLKLQLRIVFHIERSIGSKCTSDTDCKELGNAFCEPSGTCACKRAHFFLTDSGKCVPGMTIFYTSKILFLSFLTNNILASEWCIEICDLVKMCGYIRIVAYIFLYGPYSIVSFNISQWYALYSKIC